jgi:hypothetical protein
MGAKRAELVAVATAMTAGEMNLIEGVRKITALRHDVENPDDEIFMPIRAIESETDHFPIGAARAHCAPDYLQRADEEMELYLADAKADILAACREIVRAYSRELNGPGSIIPPA